MSSALMSLERHRLCCVCVCLNVPFVVFFLSVCVFVFFLFTQMSVFGELLRFWPEFQELSSSVQEEQFLSLLEKKRVKHRARERRQRRKEEEEDERIRIQVWKQWKISDGQRLWLLLKCNFKVCRRSKLMSTCPLLCRKSYRLESVVLERMQMMMMKWTRRWQKSSGGHEAERCWLIHSR